MTPSYVGRFAPTPSGPLHAGSLVAALASWLDARAHGGRWWVRIDDADGPRNTAGAAELILGQLERCGLRADAPASYQSRQLARYEAALAGLVAAGESYPCGCSRRDLQALAASGGARTRHDELVYPGTCRDGLNGRSARAYRLRVPCEASFIAWTDRRLGAQQQDVARAVGDFVLRRADGVWAYQLAVVVDDAAEGVTDVVRGEDLAGNTARQILLQRCLGLPLPRYLHTPLVLGADGEKLSKQHGAGALALDDPLVELRRAGHVLGLAVEASDVGSWLAAATLAWPYRPT